MTDNNFQEKTVASSNPVVRFVEWIKAWNYKMTYAPKYKRRAKFWGISLGLCGAFWLIGYKEFEKIETQNFQLAPKAGDIFMIETDLPETPYQVWSYENVENNEYSFGVGNLMFSDIKTARNTIRTTKAYDSKTKAAYDFQFEPHEMMITHEELQNLSVKHIDREIPLDINRVKVIIEGSCNAAITFFKKVSHQITGNTSSMLGKGGLDK